MIKTLRRKFVVTAMAAVTALLLVLLGGINGVNLWLKSRDTDMLLTALSEGEGTMRPEREGQGLFRPPLDGDAAMSAVFFVVRLDESGKAVYADVSKIASVTEAEAEEYAEGVYGSSEGREGRFKYRVTQSRDGRGSTAVFLDVSEDSRSSLIIAVLSLLAGAACWLGALLVVVLLSRRATQPIAKSMERQKQFITDAGHEIKTPLAIIRANADALELHEGENRWSRNIQRQTERMDELVKRLLMLARLDEASEQAQMQERTRYSLSETVTETAEQYREPAEAAGLGLCVQAEPGIELEGIPEAAAELVDILMDNAVKYAEPGTEIEVELSREGGRAVLKVRNRCTQPPRDPERLFDRFYREDSARTQSAGGTGLGLSIARAIAESQDAALNAKMTEENTIEFEAHMKCG